MLSFEWLLLFSSFFSIGVVLSTLCADPKRGSKIKVLDRKTCSHSQKPAWGCNRLGPPSRETINLRAHISAAATNGDTMPIVGFNKG